MQQRTINMLAVNEMVTKDTISSFSFGPFMNFIRTNLTNADDAKKALFKSTLDRFESMEQSCDAIEEEDLGKFRPLFDHIFLLLTNATQNEKEIYWGICLPLRAVLVYGTDKFYNVLQAANEYDQLLYEKSGINNDFLISELEYFYEFVLKRFYGFDLPDKGLLIRTLRDAESGQTRHYSISLNTTFVEVTALKELPEIDSSFLGNICIAGGGMEQLTKLLPVDMFAFSGFTVTTVTDISQQYALDNIKNNIVNNHSIEEENNFTDVIESLKELIGSTQVEINLLPFTTINGMMMDDPETYYKSLLFSSLQKSKAGDGNISGLAKKFIAAPYHLYSSNLTEDKILGENITAGLINAGATCYALIPVNFNNKSVGAIELWSRRKGEIGDHVLNSIELAKELLGQLLSNHNSLLEANIETIIREEYTRLQPAVQWKFTEVAWQRWQQKLAPNNKYGKYTEDIIFENVYPLYGAVDIRNSTVERNAALLQDASIQLGVLQTVLQQLKTHTEFPLLDQKIFQARHWAELIQKEAATFSQHEQLTDFFNHNIYPFLQAFIEGNEMLKNIADKYFHTIDEQTGIAFKCRRDLENSMKLVISSVNKYFDFLKDEIQTAYPCYFEKFRTDGVEYDIYIGQSISPQKTYHPIFLKNLRLMQLTSMAAIARYTHALLADMANPVETTQLIYIHAQQIDILFRNDEKRFDVEGAYNIRYHIIKKRIDKVHIKGTNERLTQPGKIALVYYSEQEAQEYISHIMYLQSDNILKDDLEKLELEELSGVIGLKALRVGVNLEATDKED